jgi:A nuclease of the HNH/ENDO VII superfamily with conserved LHH/Putative peptidoglycan binding domain
LKEQAQKQSQSRTEASSHQARFTPPTLRNQTDSTLTLGATETSTPAPTVPKTTRAPFDFSQTPIHPAAPEKAGNAPQTAGQRAQEAKAAKAEDASNVKEAGEKESTQPKEKESTQPRRNLRSKLLKGSPALESAYNGNLLIGPGTKGDGVAKIQKALNLIYQHDKTFVPLDETGDFNAQTTAAFSRFQKDNALKRGTNGVVGTETLEKLDELLNAPPPQSAYTWLPPTLTSTAATQTAATSYLTTPQSSYMWAPPTLASTASAPTAVTSYLTTPLGTPEALKQIPEQKKIKKQVGATTQQSKASDKAKALTTPASAFIWAPSAVNLTTATPAAVTTYLAPQLKEQKPAQLTPDQKKIQKTLAAVETYEQQDAWAKTRNTEFLESILEMSEMDMGTLSLHTERLKIIKDILQFTYVDSDAETALIGLLHSAPASDAPALLKALMADKNRLFKKLDSAIQGENYHGYHLALRQLVFKTHEIPQAGLKIDALQQEASPQTLPWSDPGALKLGSTIKVEYHVELTEQGKIQVMWLSSRMGVINAMSNLLEFEPFEMIGLQLKADESHLGNEKGGKGNVYAMPAINLLDMENKQTNQAIGEFFDVAMLATGIGEVAYGTKTLRVLLGAADITFGSGNLIISSYRFDIAKSKSGKIFLSRWNTASQLIAIHGLGRLVIEAPQIISKLGMAWKNFKSEPHPNISSTELHEIDEMIVSFDEAAHQAELERQAQQLVPDLTEKGVLPTTTQLNEGKLAAPDELLTTTPPPQKTITAKELEKIDDTAKPTSHTSESVESKKVESEKIESEKVESEKVTQQEEAISTELDKASASWTSEIWNRIVNFRGRKVYQRDDLINPNHVDPETGLTNLELMEKGQAPIGPDGEKIELHHVIQVDPGPIAEVTGTFHRQNKTTIHIWVNEKKPLEFQFSRGKFDYWRGKYWENRAKDFIKK